MRSLRDVSVRGKLMAITLVSAGLALLLACGAFLTYDLLAFRATMMRNASTQAQILGRLSTSALVFKDPESAAATLAALRAEPHVMSAGIYAADGTLFASYVRDAAPGPAAVPRPPAGIAEGQAFERQRLVVFRPIEFDNARIGTVLIESDSSEMAKRLQRYAAIVAAVLLASFIVAHWTASRLQRVITEPVLHLAETAHAVSQRGDYSVRAVPRGDDEIGRLIRTFNQMLDQIQAGNAALEAGREHLEMEVEARTKDLKVEISERKVLEEQLRGKNAELEEQSRRVQEATRLKSEFLANMSHELRTPLNAIIGFTELMHDAKVGPVSPEHKECLADILTSSRHLLQLINDILDLSKVEAGKMEFHPESVDVVKLVGEVRDILRSLSAKKRIVLKVEVETGLGDVVLDPGKLKQVLYNYLSNALKFTPDEGHVGVSARAEGMDYLRIEVEDNGIGIREEDLSRLFAEFQQLDGSTAKAYPGTGLGLALTKRIVEAQGGQVGVRSAPGKGSTFFAVLPRITSNLERAAPALPPRLARVGAPSVLVVEDDRKERAWLVETLAAAGYAVEVAATGREALARCRERPFDAITLDLLLSDMAGWEVLREVRSRGQNQNTPAIVVTVVAEEGVASGFAIHDYLVKPVSAEDLLASLVRAGVPATGDRSILVVDDDPQARRLIETTLERLGYRSLSAESGDEGLQLAGKLAPAAVVLDLMMPGMDGFEFLERFRLTPNGPATPVIVWTAKDLSSEDYRRLSATAHSIVRKGEGGAAPLLAQLRLCVGPGPGISLQG